MKFVIDTMTEREVLGKLKHSIREEANNRLRYVQTHEVSRNVKCDAIVWQYAAYIIDQVVDIATKNDRKFLFKDIPDEVVANSFCANLGINREGLDYRPFEFVYYDDKPMNDDEFKKWFIMLWDAVWSDNDSRFNGKTIGEIWGILEREDNFPKERFRKELERRGYRKIIPEEQHPPVQLNYHPNHMKECEELLKKAGWELIDVEPNGNHAKIRHCSLVVDIRINDCIDFEWDEGSQSYAIRHRHSCSAT